jgi:hypothetical protein
VSVTVAVDADHVVQLICKHPLHLHFDWGNESVSVRGLHTASGRTVMGHAAAKNGGQASDQANKRTPGRHRPTHADRSPTRHPPRGQSDTESRMSTVGDSLATAPDGTNRTLTVRHLCGPAQWSVVRALCGTPRQASARAVCDESTQTWFRRRELQLCDESTLSHFVMSQH